VKRSLVQYAGFPEWRGRQRIDHGVMEFNTLFVVPDHAPLDQFPIAKNVKESLEPDAEVLKFIGVRKFLSHREHRAFAGSMRQLNSDRATPGLNGRGGFRVGAIGGKRSLIDAQRKVKARGIYRPDAILQF
jgi:hypothetical protein